MSGSLLIAFKIHPLQEFKLKKVNEGEVWLLKLVGLYTERGIFPKNPEILVSIQEISDLIPQVLAIIPRILTIYPRVYNNRQLLIAIYPTPTPFQPAPSTIKPTKKPPAPIQADGHLFIS